MFARGNPICQITLETFGSSGSSALSLAHCRARLRATDRCSFLRIAAVNNEWRDRSLAKLLENIPSQTGSYAPGIHFSGSPSDAVELKMHGYDLGDRPNCCRRWDLERGQHGRVGTGGNHAHYRHADRI